MLYERTALSAAPPLAAEPVDPRADRRLSCAPMAGDYNPYAPPTPIADAPPKARSQGRLGGARVWREGELMVFEKEGARLPDRCVVCNRDTDYKLKRTFVWHPWWVYILAPMGWLFYAIIASAVRKYATIELGLCDEHQQRRRSGLILTGFGVGASILLLLIASTSRWGGMALVGFVGLIVAIVFGGRMARIATSKKIDDTYAWLRVGEPFLASLPGSPDEEPEPPRRIKKKKKKKAAKAAAAGPAGAPEGASPETRESTEAGESATAGEPAESGESPEDDGEP